MLAVALCAGCLLPAPELTSLRAAADRPWPVKVALHRGANRYAPENTLAAVKLAVELKADFVEIDIRTTKDGQFVLMHDRTVNRTTNGKGDVRGLTLPEVRKLDAGGWFSEGFRGEPVPTLDEALTALGDRTHAYLDAKDIAPEDLLAAIRKHNLMERHVVYQSVEYLTRLKKLDPRVRALPPLKSKDDLKAILPLKPFGVDAKWTALSAELIAACHQEGVQVFSDALGFFEHPDQYRKAIDWGIDVIQTDHPARVRLAASQMRKK